MELSKLNSEDEWNFITTEVHREEPTKNNLLKREVLFALEVLFANENYHLYFKLKKEYLI